MNRKGQTMFFAFMLGIVVVVLALGLANPLKQHIDEIRNGTTNTTQGLDCGNSSISDYQKGQCVITDFSLPYFIISLIGIGGTILLAKVVFS